MKTKYILTALALPALFAACTNDTFVTETPTENNSALQGRALMQLVLEAEKGTDADTRVVGGIADNGGINWYWEDNQDKIGAVVVDFGKKLDNIEPIQREVVDLENYPDYAITNYPFAPNITGLSRSANFSTPTAVRSGAYIFYNRYDGKATERGVISHEIDRLVHVSEGEKAGLVQVGTNYENEENKGQNFFISPIVNLAIPDGEEGAKIQTPINLQSVHHVLQFTLKAEVDNKYLAQDGGFQIHKIELTTMGEGDEFMRKLTIDPSKIAGIQKELAKENPGLFMANGAIDAMNLDKATTSEALRLVNEALADPENKIGELSEPTEDLVYQLDNTFKFTEADQTMKLMVILPAATYNVGNKGTEDPAYGGKEKGVFHLRIYTSEGTYDEYLLDSKKTFKRGLMTNITRTLKIKGGETNINLYDLSKGFDVETTEDYNFAIDYINAHPRDFGEGSKWGVPTLNFINEGPIEVDMAHYFPAYPVKYLGGATLVMKDKKQAYEFDPENVILGEGEMRPTIKIADKESSITFKKDIKTVAGKTDGTDYTAALKLISDAKVIVSEGKEVNFELLESGQSLDINSKATVKAGGETLTEGAVNVKEGAKLTTDGVYKNTAVMNIAKDAVVRTNEKATNEGEITVEGLGKLIAAENTTFTNAKTEDNTGKIIVKALNLPGMNDKSRAEASFATLENEGELTVEASVSYKGTYGGLVTIGTLNNSGTVSNNGETRVATTMNNTGTVTLESDPYALLDIKAGGSTGSGSIVLADATQYEMFDSYYTGRNNLKAVTGVIETTLNQADYKKVMENYATYKGKQETAWEELNKITVNGEVKLGATLTDDKDFVLAGGATLNAIEALTINSLVADGKNTAVAGGTITVAETAVVAENADMTVNVNATVIFDDPAQNPVLTIDGKLLNKGYMDAVKGSKPTTDIFVIINKTGELVNEGKMSMEAANKYEGAGYDAVEKLIEDLKVSATDFRGKYVVTEPRIDIVNKTLAEIESATFNSEEQWTSNLSGNPQSINVKAVVNLLTKGQKAKIQGYDVLAVANSRDGAWSDVLYIPTGYDIDAIIEAAKVTGLADQAIKCVNGATMPQLGTWFNVTNEGTLDLLFSANPDNAAKAWAYGESKNGNNAVKKGKFTNEME